MTAKDTNAKTDVCSTICEICTKEFAGFRGSLNPHAIIIFFKIKITEVTLGKRIVLVFQEFPELKTKVKNEWGLRII